MYRGDPPEAALDLWCKPGAAAGRPLVRRRTSSKPNGVPVLMVLYPLGKIQ